MRQKVRERHTAGLFSLMKNSEADRLIMDARPANTLEPQICDYTYTMAAVPPLLQWQLPHDRCLMTASEDLKDFYYFYQVSPERAIRNTISWKMSSRECAKWSAAAGLPEEAEVVYPALRTMAMGDLNSVEYGQQSHVRLALATGLKLDDLLTLKGRGPRCTRQWMAGIVIDDLVIIEQVPASLPRPLSSTAIADSLVDQYETVGLVSNSKKRVRGALKSKFWGISLDGEQGLVRAQLERMVPLAFLTMEVATLGFGTRKLLEVLIGSWVAVLQCRRRCMCLIYEVFQEIQDHNYEEVFCLQEATITELWALTLLSPVMVTDLKAQVRPELVLVDASNDWMAEVSSPLPAEFAQELSRHQLTKVAWSRLLSPWKALQRVRGALRPEDEVPEGEPVAATHPLWTTLIQSQQFCLKERRRISHRQHINVSELKAAVQAEKNSGRLQPNSRLLLASDSQVVLGALIKGRSSSRALNDVLKAYLPELLAFNTYTCPQYVHTTVNVADDPTRDRDCRAPQMEAPEWLRQALEGEFKMMDEFLQSCGLDDASMAQLPTDDQLVSQPVEPLPPREEARRRWVKSVKKGGHQGSRLPPKSFSRRFQPWMPRSQLSDEAKAALDVFPASQFVVPRGVSLDDIEHLPGHLDLFSGERGAARAVAEATGRWVLTFDILHSPSENLDDVAVQQTIQRCVELGSFLTITAGPVCASFSRAVRPAVRSRRQPRGFAGISANMQIKVALGNRFSLWLAGLIRLALRLELPFWVENPQLSFLWDQDEWLELRRAAGVDFFVTDYCRWRAPWRKRTSFLTNTAIAGARCLCQCGRKHLRLVGYSKRHKMSWTLVAQSYPTGLCRFLALALAEELKPVARRRALDVAACARCCGRRIGEAGNPGPRRRNFIGPRPNLAEVETLQETTLIIQRRVHLKFVRWLESELSPQTYEALCWHPHLQANFVQGFGNWLYQQGEPMYLFRHLVVLVQHSYPAMRPALAGCWTLLAKWEIVQPVSHRPPTPRLVLNAMVALAICWKWKRWSAITLLAYYGAMRIGEPLRALRRDLLLQDEAGLSEPTIFIRVGSPKSGRRGKGVVQHSRISEPLVVDFIAAVFRELEPMDELYPASSATYRHRWDRLLEALGISKDVGLTPGGLRGGGAIHMYHKGLPISDILWKMRLRQVATLESYLQEVAAENIIQRLPSRSISAVKSCSAMLPSFLAL